MESDQSTSAALPPARWPRAAARVAASGVTDVGGAESVNQDAFFVLPAEGLGALVLGVFDGHGKETGRRVAQTACAFFEQQFRGYAAEDFAELERDPRGVFQQLYTACHEQIKEALREIYEDGGFVVYEQPEGFLVKQDPTTHLFANVRGGTTATVAVILGGGRKILVSNVGDSAGLLSGTGVSARDVKIFNGKTAGNTSGGSGCNSGGDHSKASASSHEDTDGEDEEELEALEIRESCASIASTATSSLEMSDNQEPLPLAHTSIVALTGHHGAESAAEFLRMRRARCCDLDPSMPALRFLYDTASASARRQPVFSWSDTGELGRNSPGDYFKNVRDEWATVVATPQSSLFPDALAFTRSLGDLHMHAYGVSCDPTVVELSLERLLAREREPSDADNQVARDGGAAVPRRFTFVMASDGVWDNWKYEELFQSLRAARAACGDAKYRSNAHAVDAMAAALMRANLVRAEETFGDQADNMTAIVCEIEVSCVDDQ